MIADQHLHTRFSTDSTSSPEDMIREAVRRGMKALCVTDHFDMDYPADPETGEIPFQLDVPAYFRKISEMKEMFQGEIKIGLGVELGIQEHLADRLGHLLQERPFDFVIGSFHLIDGKDPYYPDSFPELTDRELYRAYFQSMMRTLGKFHGFDALGHLDYVVRYGKKKQQDYRWREYADEIDEILKLLIRYQIALEVNTGGLKYGLGFPNPHPEILRRYKELGGELVTAGSDAHEPRYIGYGFEAAKELLEQAGFRYYVRFENRHPVFLPL